jgi:hypothetical protein
MLVQQQPYSSVLAQRRFGDEMQGHDITEEYRKLRSVVYVTTIV